MNWEPIISWLADNAIALLALIIAGWSALYTYKHSGKSVQLQEEALEMEKRKERKEEEDSKKAWFKLSFNMSRRTAKPHTDQLRIKNLGKCDARNVKVSINGKNLNKFEPIFNKAALPDFYQKIGSGLVEVVRITTTKDTDRVWNIEILWDDDANKGNKEEFSLRL